MLNISCYFTVKIPAVRAGIVNFTIPLFIFTSETFPKRSVKIEFIPNGLIIETSNETSAGFVSLLKTIKTALSL